MIVPLSRWTRELEFMWRSHNYALTDVERTTGASVVLSRRASLPLWIVVGRNLGIHLFQGRWKEVWIERGCMTIRGQARQESHESRNVVPMKYPSQSNYVIRRLIRAVPMCNTNHRGFLISFVMRSSRRFTVAHMYAQGDCLFISE
jgi:hypothetical protein